MDILLDHQTLNLRIENGDLVFGEDDDLNIQLVLLSNKGDWKQYPLIGGEIVKKISAGLGALERRQIAVDLKAGGYNLRSVSAANDGLLNLDYDAL